VPDAAEIKQIVRQVQLLRGVGTNVGLPRLIPQTLQLEHTIRSEYSSPKETTG
jgi:hypothetical protein